VRPSSSTTVNASREQDASIAIASLLATKVGIPSLQEKISILFDQVANDCQLMTSKPSIRRQIYRIKPELCVTPGVSDVNVRRFTILKTIEIESVSTNPQQYGHRVSLHPLSRETAVAPE
jgi:hypothetical protein